MADDQRPAAETARPKRLPYTTPVLTVYGPVGQLTETRSPSGTQMDGGPNNSKT
jgi:hypothetical protein